MTWIRAVLRAVRRLPRAIGLEIETLRWEEYKRETVAALERDAVRTIPHPVFSGEKLYEMRDGRLLRFHVGIVLPVSEWDAEDIYGWTKAR